MTKPKTNLKHFAQVLAASLAFTAAAVTPAVASVHDAGANGNSILFSDYAGSPTTFSATATVSQVQFQCFAPSGPQLPETIMTIAVGPQAGAGSINSTAGGNASRFEISWLQASTSNTVTFSPRFVASSVNSGSTPTLALTINYTTFSLQVTTSDTVKLSYAAPAGGANDFYAAPSAGGAAVVANKPLSFSNLVITPTTLPNRSNGGACFPVVISGSGSGSGSSGSSGGQSGSAGSAAPKYSGPEFSSFGSATLAGNKLVTSGKKLDSITSMKINGTAVTYKLNSASELEIELPKDLAPGKYDVEINSVHGKLTHLQGITIKAVVPTKEISFKADGAWFNYGSLIELTNAAKQIGSDYTSVKCIVNAADPVVAERLAKRACSYIEANRLRGKAVSYESKSTYKGEGFWVKVVANG